MQTTPLFLPNPHAPTPRRWRVGFKGPGRRRGHGAVVRGEEQRGG